MNEMKEVEFYDANDELIGSARVEESIIAMRKIVRFQLRYFAFDGEAYRELDGIPPNYRIVG